MKFALVFLALFLCGACGGPDSLPVENTIVDDTALKSDLEVLRNARVFFGHHSVGSNILDGLRELARAAKVEIDLGDGPVGVNQQPVSKFEAFASYAESESDSREDLLLMKLCYVDFNPDADVASLVNAYAHAVERVRKARPSARVVHVTPPLTVWPTDVKSKVKRSIGRAVWEDQANLRRMEFREQLLLRFPDEPFFDLAVVESTRPDGTREVHDVGGVQVPMLWPGYSSDGGHLNELGQRVAARAFARALASALR